MNSPSPDRKALEKLWRHRLDEAKLRLEFARNYVNEVKRDFFSPDIPAADGNFAYKKAMRSESLALSQYNRILHIYRELTVNGIIPDEAGWSKGQPASANGNNPGLAVIATARPEPALKTCPERARLDGLIRALMDQMLTLYSEQLNALVRYNFKKSQSLELQLSRARTRKDRLLEEYQRHVQNHRC